MPSLNTGNAILSNPIKVDSSYNVGIGGAASGSFKLQVTGTGNFTGALSGTSATFSGRVGINGAPSTTFGLESYGEGRFYQPLTNTTAYLRVENNRTRNAAVYTATTNGGFYAGVSIGTDTFNYQIYDGVAGSARLTIASTGAATFSAASGGAITLTTNGSANNWTSAITGNSTTSQSYGLLIQAGTNSTDAALRVRNQANSLDWLFVRGDGNVGIGTTSPDSKLHIISDASASTNNYALRLQNTTTAADARVGIAFLDNSNTGGSGSGATIQVSNNGVDGAGNLIFGTLLNGTNTERMRINTGYSVTVANGVATTLFNISSVLSVGAMGLVTVYASSGPGLGLATLVIMRDGYGGVSQAQIGTQPTAAYLSFSISGTNLQVTASIGAGTHTIQGTIVRISA